MTKAGANAQTKFTLQGVSSSSSIFPYAGVMEEVAMSVARCDPDDIDITPILSGEKPRFWASERTTLTARCASCQAVA